MKKFIINSINRQLKQLDAIGGFIGFALVNKNGLLLKSRLPRDINDKVFGAMSATIFEGIQTGIQSFDPESISYITVELNDCQVISLSVTDEILLVIVLQLDVNLGLILIEIEQIVKNVNDLILNE
ncbi:MAG: roadblock/LC7 domain-containing protein [Candidatus Lokiarchaeota archaeon]